MNFMKKAASAIFVTAISFSSIVHAQEIKRDPVPDFPISSAVTIPAGATTYYLSGMVPSKEGSGYGDTQQQTENVLKSIKSKLESMGLSLGDVVKMQVFLVGDKNKGGKMDFAGFMKGYTKYFGTKAQPQVPARSAYQVAALANPEFLIEIEVTAAKAK